MAMLTESSSARESGFRCKRVRPAVATLDATSTLLRPNGGLITQSRPPGNPSVEVSDPGVILDESAFAGIDTPTSGACCTSLCLRATLRAEPLIQEGPRQPPSDGRATHDRLWGVQERTALGTPRSALNGAGALTASSSPTGGKQPWQVPAGVHCSRHQTLESQNEGALNRDIPEAYQSQKRQVTNGDSGGMTFNTKVIEPNCSARPADRPNLMTSTNDTTTDGQQTLVYGFRPITRVTPASLGDRLVEPAKVNHVMTSTAPLRAAEPSVDATVRRENIPATPSLDTTCTLRATSDDSLEGGARDRAEVSAQRQKINVLPVVGGPSLGNDINARDQLISEKLIAPNAARVKDPFDLEWRNAPLNEEETAELAALAPGLKRTQTTTSDPARRAARATLRLRVADAARELTEKVQAHVQTRTAEVAATGTRVQQYVEEQVRILAEAQKRELADALTALAEEYCPLLEHLEFALSGNSMLRDIDTVNCLRAEGKALNQRAHLLSERERLASLPQTSPDDTLALDSMQWLQECQQYRAKLGDAPRPTRGRTPPPSYREASTLPAPGGNHVGCFPGEFPDADAMTYEYYAETPARSGTPLVYAPAPKLMDATWCSPATSSPVLIAPQRWGVDARPHASLPRKIVRIEKYNANDPFDLYLQRFKVTSDLNDWTDTERAAHLALSLEPSEFQSVRQISCHEPQAYARMTQILLAHYGATSQRQHYLAAFAGRCQMPDESLAKFARELQALGDRAYPTLGSTQRDNMVCDRFMRTVHDVNLRRYLLRGDSVTSMSVVLPKAIAYEAGRDELVEPTSPWRVEPQSAGTKPGSLHYTPTRHAFDTLAALQPLQQQLNALVLQVRAQSGTRVTGPAPPTTTRDSGRSKSGRTCYQCGRQGHLSRDCHQHQPTATAPTRSGRRRAASKPPGEPTAGAPRTPSPRRPREREHTASFSLQGHRPTRSVDRQPQPVQSPSKGKRSLRSRDLVQDQPWADDETFFCTDSVSPKKPPKPKPTRLETCLAKTIGVVHAKEGVTRPGRRPQQPQDDADSVKVIFDTEPTRPAGNAQRSPSKVKGRGGPLTSQAVQVE